MAENIKILTDDNFETEVLKSDRPTLVDFWATWCAPCRAIAPYVEEVAKLLGDKLNVGKMDIDNNPKIPTAYDVRSIPTLLLFKDGKVVGQLVGAVPKLKIHEFVKKVTGA
jgi:thioredoxin 1